MGLVERGDGWRIPDVLWSQIEPLIPSGKPHPLGCHNPRVRDRDAMTAILFVLRAHFAEGDHPFRRIAITDFASSRSERSDVSL